MKKLIIGALVGGLILFFWQFLSFGLLNVHASGSQYTPNQDAILEVLNANLTEDGTYFLPRVEPGASAEEEQAFMTQQLGKPWAVVSYRKAFNLNFGMNLFRGFIIDFLAVFLLAWFLMKMEKPDFQSAILGSLAVGLIGYLTISYLDSVWYETNSIPYLIDALVQWGLTGAWLGWWLNRD